MPKPIPFPMRLKKETPADNLQSPENPTASAPVEQTPAETPKVTEQPDLSKLLDETPVESKPNETQPEHSPEKTEMPSDNNESNCVIVDGQKIEIKPTKLKYFRNKGASGYGIIKAVPLHELLTYGKGVVDKERDADQLLYDFLVAAFDDSTFVRDHYDNMDAETVEQVIRIFGRINYIDEKEEAARKNREAQVKR